MPNPPIRVALICDYREEGWPSMDLVGEMTLHHLRDRQAEAVAVEQVRPPFRHRAARWARGNGRLARAARNADRLANRFGDYPRVIRQLARSGRHDVFHLVDHSYAHLVHDLPPGRAVVTCNDLDTFRCLLRPDQEPRPRWFRAMARRILTGMQKAAVVPCISEATRSAILDHRLIPEERLPVVPLAIPEELNAQADPPRDAQAADWLGPPGPADLLHVGSTIPRKRIDVLLDVFAAIRQARPEARLIRVGAPFTAEQAFRAEALGLTGAITNRSGLDRPLLAAIYRRASLVLQPSDAEGFGLPVTEAMACGTAVLASDLPPLREAGGAVATYRPVADVPAWTAAALDLLAERQQNPVAWAARRHAGLAWAAEFRWDRHVARLVPLYQAVAAGRHGG